MPTRTSLAPGRRPEILAILRAASFPEDKVRHAVFFIFIRVGTGLCSLAEVEGLGIEVSQLTVVSVGRDAKVNGSVVTAVGVTGIHEALDEQDLLGDMGNGARLHVGRKAVESCTILVEFLRPLGGVLRQRNALCLRVADRLVIHIREIAYMFGTQSAKLHDPSEDILRHESAKVADVSSGVNGRTATVETQSFSILRFHGKNTARAGVKER